MTKVLSIKGMSCGHCVTRVEAAVSAIQGVTSVKVNLGQKSAVVEGVALDDARLKEAVADAGYEVVTIASA